MLRVLTFTNLYPNPVQPRHGIFVEHRLRRLVATGAIAAKVIAPSPWCPLPVGGRFPEYRVKGVPAVDRRDGIDIYHPRYWVVPGVTSNLNPRTMMWAGLPVARSLARSGFDCDLIDAQFLYPDGMAGVLLAERLGKPVTITARGSDVNVALRETGPQRWLRWAMPRVSAWITVSAALKQALVEYGVDEARIHVLRNGVDMTLFAERERLETRARLEVGGTLLLSVGNLVEGKGHHVVVEALASIPNAKLIVIGKGPEEARLRDLAQRLGLESRVKFVPNVSQAELATYYSAADVTVLASAREGMANVLLESLACGTPVVATTVGGNPEVVTEAIAGKLLADRTAAAFASAICEVLAATTDRDGVRRYAERFGWDVPIGEQVRLFESVAKSTTLRDVA